MPLGPHPIIATFTGAGRHLCEELVLAAGLVSEIEKARSIENAGDTIKVEDFRTGESYIGLIEEMDFRNATPSDKRFTGYGGTLLVTIRTV